MPSPIEFVEHQQNYERYYADDSECSALRDSFLLAFTADGVNLLTAHFVNIHRLVYAITKRFNEKTILTIGIQSLRTIVKKWTLCSNQPEHLLDIILYQWHCYQNGANLIHSLTVYAHSKASRFRQNHWHHLVRYIFGEYLMSQEDLFSSIVLIINENKNNGSNETKVNLVKQIFNLLQYLDIDNHLLYYRLFGVPYLKLVQRRYRSKMVLSTLLDPIEYLHQVEKIICEEVEVGIQYGFTSALTRMLAKVLYGELVTRRQDNILCNEHCQLMIQSGQMDSLSYLYQIIVYDKSNLRILMDIVERTVQSQLNEIKVPDWRLQSFSIQKCSQLVEQAHRLLECWLNIVKEVFANDELLAQAVTKSFGQYLSSNQAHLYIIILFIHLVSLRHCSLESSTFSRQEAIKQAFSLMWHLEDKTPVVKGNCMFLCQRLLHQISYDSKLDAEILANWHDSVDNAQATTIRLLYKDYQKSEPNLIQNCNGAQLEVTLLNSSLWSLNQPRHKFALPHNLALLYRNFKKNFIEKHPRKTIEFNYDYGTAEIDTYFEKFKGKFVVTLRQAVILLALDQTDQLTGVQLITIVKMERQILMEQVDVFTRFGLVQVNQQEDTFCINNDFEVNDVGDYYRNNETINWIQLYHESSPCNIVTIMETLNSSCDLPSLPTNTTTHESNADVNNYRLEAAIVRVLKRVQVVNDAVTLHKMAYETLRSDTNSNGTLLSLDKFHKILASLESRDFLRFLDNGNIVYEP